MAFENWPELDPEEVLDFGFDWVDRLEDAETIINSDWFVDDGTVEIRVSPAPSIGGTITKLWLTGGAPGETCLVRNHIVCSSGRERERTAKLKIKDK